MGCSQVPQPQRQRMTCTRNLWTWVVQAGLALASARSGCPRIRFELDVARGLTFASMLASDELNVFVRRRNRCCAPQGLFIEISLFCQVRGSQDSRGVEANAKTGGPGHMVWRSVVIVSRRV